MSQHVPVPSPSEPDAPSSALSVPEATRLDPSLCGPAALPPPSDSNAPLAPPLSRAQRWALRASWALFLLLVVLPWALVLVVVSVAAYYLAFAETLEDGDGFVPSLFATGWWLGVGTLTLAGVVSVAGFRRARNARTRAAVPAPSSTEPTTNHLDPRRPLQGAGERTWTRWVPRRWSLMLVVGLILSIRIFRRVLYPGSGATTVSELDIALLFFTGTLLVTWGPWWMASRGWYLLRGLMRSSKRSSWRAGFATALLCTVTLNPCPSVVSRVRDAVVSDRRSEAPWDGTNEVFADATRLSGRIGNSPHTRRAAPDSFLMTVPDVARQRMIVSARDIHHGAEPDGSHAPRRFSLLAPAQRHAFEECMESLYTDPLRQRNCGTEISCGSQWARQRGVPATEYEDVAMDAALRVCVRYASGSIELRDGLGPYYQRTLENATHDYHRRRARERDLCDVLPIPTVLDPPPPGWTGEDHAWERLRERNPQDYEVLELFFMRELTAVEVAQRLGITPDAARQRKKRALDRARELLAD